MVRFIKSQVDFDEELTKAGGKLVVVDFTATWCRPCQAIAPAFEDLSKKEPNVVFLKCDVDENQETPNRYGVNSMPTFKFFKNKANVHSFCGANVNMLRDGIARFK